jgi:hypothetical protein
MTTTHTINGLRIIITPASRSANWLTPRFASHGPAWSTPP